MIIFPKVQPKGPVRTPRWAENSTNIHASDEKTGRNAPKVEEAGRTGLWIRSSGAGSNALAVLGLLRPLGRNYLWLSACSALHMRSGLSSPHQLPLFF